MLGTQVAVVEAVIMSMQNPSFLPIEVNFLPASPQAPEKSTLNGRKKSHVVKAPGDYSECGTS